MSEERRRQRAHGPIPFRGTNPKRRQEELLAEADGDRLAADARTLTTAQAIADETLGREVRGSLDTILTDNLTRAIGETLADVRAVAETFRAGIPDAQSVPHLPKATADAWHALDRSATRYARIRDAQWRVAQLGGGPQLGDVYSEFGDPMHERIWGMTGWRGGTSLRAVSRGRWVSRG